jgi:hypothetical protein
MPESQAYDRGRNEAYQGYDFAPEFWHYKPGSKQEYDYARGYASECNIAAALRIIEEHDAGREAAIPAGPAFYYEPDGNILRHFAPGR